jgi:hypothetical protein
VPVAPRTLDGTKSVPRVSDDDADGPSGVHVPGVWFGVIGEIRNRDSTSVHRYLGSPIEVLTLEVAAYSALAERARGDAERLYEGRLAARDPVVVSRALLRAPTLRVPKDVLLQDRSTKTFRVFPDDTIEPTE